jgi:PQQ-dependent dehydrogenase (methanol/ethanol family)
LHRRRTPWALALALGLVLTCSSAAYAKVGVTAGPARAAAAAITAAPAFSSSQLSEVPSRNWLANGGNIQNQRYSTLSQINSGNVGQLKGVWRTHLGSGSAAKYSQEATPVVYEGVMYIPTGNNDVSALDATTGEIIWQYKSGINQQISTICCGWDSRGVAIGDGMVFSAQLDGYVVAIDMKTGHAVWKVPNVLWQEGYSQTSAPAYADGKVIVGMTGGEFGARGSVTAYDAKNGERVWRFYTCPQPGDFGGATWGLGEWQTCGATVWGTPSIDPQLGLVYFTTSNADPWTGRKPGMNLFSSSMVAVTLNKGEYRWHYQVVHHDIWDYDCPSPTFQFDVEMDGQMRKGIGEACKTGWLYLLDRTNGTPLVGINEKKVPQNKWANTWPTQPYPVGDSFVPQCAQKAKYKNKAPDGKPFKVGCIFTPYDNKQFTAFAPSALGGTNWPPTSYSPKTSYAYVCAAYTDFALKALDNVYDAYAGGNNFTGISFGALNTYGGTFTAIDVRTNKIAWQKKWSGTCYSGSVATAGNVVFVGRNNGEVQAYAADTGAQLWRFKTDAGANAPAITYEVNGKQYVAILSGGNAFASPRAKGDSVWVFALDGTIPSGARP